MKKLYKISTHTKRIISVLMIFLQMRLVGVISNSLNSKSVKDYHTIISNFSEFLHDEGIEDPQHIYEYYNYAMWNGYFSKEHELQYTLDRDIYIDNAGMSIMSGDAVCLNYADMLSLIYKEMGYKSSMIMCYVNPDEITKENIRTDKEIERKIDSTNNNFLDNIFFETLTKITGNHAITCVENNGELYFFDPTNLIYLNKTGINDVSIINGTGKFDIKYFTSLLIDNVDIFKVITKINKDGYKEEVIGKQTISINIEKLEELYNSQIENIGNVSKNNDKNNPLITLLLYSFIASFIVILTERIIGRLVNKFESNEIRFIFPKLKEYFNEKNIKTEFEILKNYELLETEIGIKNNILKDIFKKTINILEILINDRNYYHLMLVLCLNHLGYNATSVCATKYTNEYIEKEIRLIKYYENDNEYIYDYETEELLYRDEDNILRSLNNRYEYYIDSYKTYNPKKEYSYMSKELIKDKMNNENNILTKEDIKTLRKTKLLRK